MNKIGFDKLSKSIFVDKNLKNSMILLYFFLVSIVTAPLMQEYFDPLILILTLTFFSTKIFINYKKLQSCS